MQRRSRASAAVTIPKATAHCSMACDHWFRPLYVSPMHLYASAKFGFSCCACGLGQNAAAAGTGASSPVEKQPAPPACSPNRSGQCRGLPPLQPSVASECCASAGARPRAGHPGPSTCTAGHALRALRFTGRGCAQHGETHVRFGVVRVDARGHFVRFHRLDVACLQK